jgi:hypothetical protein
MGPKKKTPPTTATIAAGSKKDGENETLESPRKKFKIQARPSFNLKAWQIKGEELNGEILCFYVQKSINSKLPEQPYLRLLISKLLASATLRQEDLAIFHVGARLGSDGESMPPTDNLAGQGLPWSLFFAQKSVVSSLREWLAAVQDRLNEDDIRLNPQLFRFAPVFQVTSFGPAAALNTGQL